MTTDPLPIDVRLEGWGVRDEVHLANLPAPAPGRPQMVTVLDVPGLNGHLQAQRGDRNLPYPDEYGQMHCDDTGRILTLTLLGQEWLVRAQLAHEPTLDMPYDLDRHEAHVAARKAFDTLEAYRHD